MSNPAAWHPDPTGKHDHRWWDGERWTEHVADAGRSSIDPLEGGGAPADATDAGAADAGATDAGAAETAASAGWADQGGSQPSDGWSQPADGGGGQPTSGQQPDATESSEAVGQWQQPGSAQPADRSQATGQWQQPQPGPGQPTWQQPGGGQPTWQQPDTGGPTWQQPAAGAAPAGSDGLAIAAMIVGILSLLTSWLVIGALGGIVAIVLGFLARGRVKQSGREGNGLAVTGIVTGFLAVIIGGIVIAVGAWLFTTEGGIGGTVSGYIECLEETDGDQEFCDSLLEEELLDRFGG